MIIAMIFSFERTESRDRGSNEPDSTIDGIGDQKIPPLVEGQAHGVIQEGINRWLPIPRELARSPLSGNSVDGLVCSVESKNPLAETRRDIKVTVAVESQAFRHHEVEIQCGCPVLARGASTGDGRDDPRGRVNPPDPAIASI